MVKLKKTFMLILVLLFFLSLSACGVGRAFHGGYYYDSYQGGPYPYYNNRGYCGR